MSIRNETLLIVPDVVAMFPGTTEAGVRGWIRVGLKGIRLESFRCGKRLYTSKEAVDRFVETINTAVPRSLRLDTAGREHVTDGEAGELCECQAWSESQNIERVDEATAAELDEFAAGGEGE